MVTNLQLNALFSPFSHLFVNLLPLVCTTLILLVCMAFKANEPRGARPTRLDKVYSPKRVGWLRLKKFH